MICEISTFYNIINWNAAGVDRIKQNVINLINIYQYEVAYDRTLGLNNHFLDMPLEEAQTIITSEIMDLISEREPRASIEAVEFISIDGDGDINLKVVIDIDEY